MLYKQIKLLFEIRLDTKSWSITHKHSTTIETEYLKLKSNSGRFSITIWEAITLGLKRPVHFLHKEKWMNSEIYVNRVLEKLELPFFKVFVEERKDVI